MPTFDLLVTVETLNGATQFSSTGAIASFHLSFPSMNDLMEAEQRFRETYANSAAYRVKFVRIDWF